MRAERDNVMSAGKLKDARKGILEVEARKRRLVVGPWELIRYTRSGQGGSIKSRQDFDFQLSHFPDLAHSIIATHLRLELTEIRLGLSVPLPLGITLMLGLLTAVSSLRSRVGGFRPLRCEPWTPLPTTQSLFSPGHTGGQICLESAIKRSQFDQERHPLRQ